MEFAKSFENQAEKVFIDIGDIEEAREFIRENIEKGELPIISVPIKYAEVVKSGIKENSSWIGGNIVAGTIAREPYVLENEERIFFRIKALFDQIEPRFTGPDKHFHGVVVFKGPIFPEMMEQTQLYVRH